MAVKEIVGFQIDVNEEGFMTDHSQWNEEIAVAIAKEEGIELTERHWEIIRYFQEYHKKNDKSPSIRTMKKEGIPTKEFYSLFPSGPLKKASKISGYKKPVGCI